MKTPFLFKSTAAALLVSFALLGCSSSDSGGSSDSKDEAPTSPTSELLVLTADIEKGSTCANGGSSVKSGLDTNDNDILDADEVTKEQNICYPAETEYAVLHEVNPESRGENCIYGGQRITLGADKNQNSVLDSEEIVETTYLCNSLPPLANGAAIVDAWGDVWDAIPREPVPFELAEDECDSSGGRLPTATEVYRNRVIGTQLDVSKLISGQDSTQLWTRSSDVNYQVYVSRLSDGSMTVESDSDDFAYRCIWPKKDYQSFTGNACFSNPNGNCESVSEHQNMDALNRPAMTYAAAIAECNFYKAGIPDMSEWQQAIHQIPSQDSNAWLWASNSQYWYNAHIGSALVKWSSDEEPQWNYSQNKGSYNYVTASHNFRCIGQKQPDILQTVTSPNCNGHCFTKNIGDRTLVIDAEDREKVNQADAAQDCASDGGHLPTRDELGSLIRQGLPNGNGTEYLWLADPLYWYSGGYGYGIARWTGTGSPQWILEQSGINTTYSFVLPSSLRHYRCLWRPRTEDLPQCQSNEIIKRTESGLACTTAAEGDTQNNATGVAAGHTDSKGNKWDLVNRLAANYQGAVASCANLGGRLPTLSEYDFVRVNNVYGEQTIGTSADADYLWTGSVSSIAERAFTTVLNSNLRTQRLRTDQYKYRCIWPAEKASVLSGHHCEGGCFTVAGNSTLIADAYNRSSAPVSTAMEECRAVGGRLPKIEEIQYLIHNGWSNSQNVWQWSADSKYWYNGGYGYGTAKWVDGDSDWTYSSSKGGVGAGTSNLNYRCIYSTNAE